MDNFAEDLVAVSQIDAIPTILEVICRTTGLGFSAVARVTEDRWIACAVLDGIAFGLEPGGELRVETTICNEIRQTGRLVAIDHVTQDPRFCRHPTPERYGFQSYISVPITLRDGRFFGTLCAIDPKPAHLNGPETIGMFTLFADLIAFHLDAREQVATLESLVAQRTVALHDANAELQGRIRASDADRQALRALTDRLERVREDERTALARELHDEFGQALTAMKIDLSAMREALEPVADRVVPHPRAMIDSMDGVVDSALDSIERIVSELRPAVLDTLGCAAAAEWLVSQFQKRAHLRTHFDLDQALEPSPESGTAVFRILQEALTNISRHAHATSVNIHLQMDGDDIVLRIADDGIGMSQADHDKLGAFGLKGMAERVRALNGSVTFGTPAGGGTQLLVRVPAFARRADADPPVFGSRSISVDR